MSNPSAQLPPANPVPGLSTPPVVRGRRVEQKAQRRSPKQMPTQAGLGQPAPAPTQHSRQEAPQAMRQPGLSHVSLAPRTPTAAASSGQEIASTQPPNSNSSVVVLLQEVIARIDDARPMPLSGSVMVNREELLALLDASITAFPGELQQARWVLREREEMLTRAATDANLLIDEARARVAQMVQRTEVVRTAERRARQLIDDAQAQARARRHEIDDYCERRLQKISHDLSQTYERVQTALRKLHASGMAQPDPNLAAQRQGQPDQAQHVPTQAQMHAEQEQTMRHPQMSVSTAPGAAANEATPAPFATTSTRPPMFDQEKA